MFFDDAAGIGEEDMENDLEHVQTATRAPRAEAKKRKTAPKPKPARTIIRTLNPPEKMRAVS